jgi:aspartate carbamoyltransferase regulatory subunit
MGFVRGETPLILRVLLTGKQSRKKSLVLIEDSGTGIIIWALNLEQYVNFTGEWSISQIKNAVGYAVFNNMNVKKFPYWREVLKCQGEFCTTEKNEWEKIKWDLLTV